MQHTGGKISKTHVKMNDNIKRILIKYGVSSNSYVQWRRQGRPRGSKPPVSNFS